MTTAALTCQPKVIECPTLRRHLGLGREVHELRVGSTAILTAILLDEAVKLLPLAGEREVARIALHDDWEIHDAVLLVCEGQFVFRRLEQ
jgi:hypothetical protein